MTRAGVSRTSAGGMRAGRPGATSSWTRALARAWRRARREPTRREPTRRETMRRLHRRRPRARRWARARVSARGRSTTDARVVARCRCVRAMTTRRGRLTRETIARRRVTACLDATDNDDVYVGRIRQDISQPNNKGLDLFVCGDQIKKGAALNAVQCAELLLK